MSTEIVKINAADFGLEENKAAEIAAHIEGRCAEL